MCICGWVHYLSDLSHCKYRLKVCSECCTDTFFPCKCFMSIINWPGHLKRNAQRNVFNGHFLSVISVPSLFRQCFNPHILTLLHSSFQLRSMFRANLQSWVMIRRHYVTCLLSVEGYSSYIVALPSWSVINYIYTFQIYCHIVLSVVTSPFIWVTHFSVCQSCTS